MLKLLSIQETPENTNPRLNFLPSHLTVVTASIHPSFKRHIHADDSHCSGSAGNIINDTKADIAPHLEVSGDCISLEEAKKLVKYQETFAKA
ncbi:hypothetical protein VB005_04723 [Metarhizium brunneum]